MNEKTAIRPISMILGILLILSGSCCQKREGCTNIQSLIYDEKATADDYSRIQSGSIAPFFNIYVSDEIATYGYLELYSLIVLF